MDAEQIDPWHHHGGVLPNGDGVQVDHTHEAGDRYHHHDRPEDGRHRFRPLTLEFVSRDRKQLAIYSADGQLRWEGPIRPDDTEEAP